jgi:hypothetical protein
VVRTSAVETTISVASLLNLLNIWPYARKPVYTLLAVGAGGKPVCQVGHSVAVL